MIINKLKIFEACDRLVEEKSLVTYRNVINALPGVQVAELEQEQVLRHINSWRINQMLGKNQAAFESEGKPAFGTTSLLDSINKDKQMHDKLQSLKESMKQNIQTLETELLVAQKRLTCAQEKIKELETRLSCSTIQRKEVINMIHGMLEAS